MADVPEQHCGDIEPHRPHMYNASAVRDCPGTGTEANVVAYQEGDTSWAATTRSVNMAAALAAVPDLNTDQLNEALAGAVGPLQVYVWLAERIDSPYREILGIFSSTEKAKKVCQDEANEFFGERSTPALTWTGDDVGRSASYHHPVGGMQLFSVTRYVVDEE